MFGSFLITLREGLEAALIIGIILAYLARLGQRRHFGTVWLGTAVAILISLGAGWIFFATAAEFTGRAEQLFEGLVSLLAVGVLTYMIFWMRKQAINIKRELHARIDAALEKRSVLSLAALAFVAVLREGIETVLFMFALTRAVSPIFAVIGGILGLSLAVVLGYALYAGGRRLNLRTFFNVTGILIILIAAGLLAYGIHELNEAGIVPPVVEHVWDINFIINEKSTVGSLLKSLFGYNANPSLTEAVGYVVYLILIGWFFLRPARGKTEAVSERA